MKGNYKFGIGLLTVVTLIIAVIQAGQKEPINWRRTYNPNDKIPFGTYVIHQELKNFFPENNSVSSITPSIYVYLKDSVTQKEKMDFLFIGITFDPGKTALESLLAFANRGNNVFISAWNLPQDLKDTLHLSTQAFSSFEANVPHTKDSVYYELSASGISGRYDKNDLQLFFDKLDTQTVTILGYLRRENVRLPNFIKVRSGKGAIFIQLTPDVYSNYFLLNPETFPVAFASLQHLNGKHILWYDGQYLDNVHTPLRFILRQPALRAAWYLLLTALLLLLLFKSKREQAAIPIVRPEENQSVSFAETIGALYYENGHPGNMIHKKINYFLYALKKQFRFDVTDIHLPAFRKEAYLKLKIPQTEIDAFFDKINNYQNLSQPSTSDLKAAQELIEDFKRKIKLS